MTVIVSFGAFGQCCKIPNQAEVYWRIRKLSWAGTRYAL